MDMWFGLELRCIKMTAKQIQDKQSATPGIHRMSVNHSYLYGVVCKETT